jgi:hypothetical protein
MYLWELARTLSLGFVIFFGQNVIRQFGIWVNVVALSPGSICKEMTKVNKTLKTLTFLQLKPF